MPVFQELCLTIKQIKRTDETKNDTDLELDGIAFNSL